MDARVHEDMKTIVGNRFIVKTVHLPPDRFVVGAWPSTVPASSDIEFELAQALGELNRKLTRANAYLESVATLAPGANIDEAQKNAIERNFPRFNTAIAEITQSKLVQLKNRIAQETKKLQKRKDDIPL